MSTILTFASMLMHLLTNTFVSPDHYIVASFNLSKPVSLLEDNILQLEDNIFDEIVAPSTKVLALFFLIRVFIFCVF